MSGGISGTGKHTVYDNTFPCPSRMRNAWQQSTANLLCSGADPSPGRGALSLPDESTEQRWALVLWLPEKPGTVKCGSRACKSAKPQQWERGCVGIKFLLVNLDSGDIHGNHPANQENAAYCNQDCRENFVLTAW